MGLSPSVNGYWHTFPWVAVSTHCYVCQAHAWGLGTGLGICIGTGLCTGLHDGLGTSLGNVVGTGLGKALGYLFLIW